MSEKITERAQAEQTDERPGIAARCAVILAALEHGPRTGLELSKELDAAFEGERQSAIADDIRTLQVGGWVVRDPAQTDRFRLA
jgi:hypothetical protein